MVKKPGLGGEIASAMAPLRAPGLSVKLNGPSELLAGETAPCGAWERGPSSHASERPKLKGCGENIPVDEVPPMKPRDYALAALGAALMAGAGFGLLQAGPQAPRPKLANLAGVAPGWLTRYERGRDKPINPLDAFFLGEEQRGAHDFAAQAFESVVAETGDWGAEAAGPDRATYGDLDRGLAFARSDHVALVLRAPFGQSPLPAWTAGLGDAALKQAALHRLAALGVHAGPAAAVSVISNLLETPPLARRLGDDGVRDLFIAARKAFPGARLQLDESPFARGLSTEASNPFAPGLDRVAALSNRLTRAGAPFDEIGVRLDLDSETVARLGGERRTLAFLVAALKSLHAETGRNIALTGFSYADKDPLARARLVADIARLSAVGGPLRAVYFNDWAPGLQGGADAALIRRDGGATEAGLALLRS